MAESGDAVSYGGLMTWPPVLMSVLRGLAGMLVSCEMFLFSIQFAHPVCVRGLVFQFGDALVVLVVRSAVVSGRHMPSGFSHARDGPTPPGFCAYSDGACSAALWRGAYPYAGTRFATARLSITPASIAAPAMAAPAISRRCANSFRYLHSGLRYFHANFIFLIVTPCLLPTDSFTLGDAQIGPL
jgi:hypothetical protein